MDTNKIIYDWLSFTSKFHSEHGIIELLGLDNPILTWQIIKGAHGYQDRLYFDKVSVHYNGREDMGVWCELSGQGCRAFETYGHGDYKYIFDEIKENPNEMNLTRLDVAYDDFDGLLDIDKLIEDTRNQNYISPFRDWAVHMTSKGSSLEFGSMKSDIFIRIYDKARERGFTDGRHWVRLEIQFRRERAFGFAISDLKLGDKFVGVLNNYLRFVVPSADTNKRRWGTAPYWQKFIDSALRISIYEKPGVEYNEVNLENYVFHQAGNSIDTYIKCFGEEKFFNKLKKRNTILSPKHQFLIDKYTNGVIRNDDTNTN